MDLWICGFVKGLTLLSTYQLLKLSILLTLLRTIVLFIFNLSAEIGWICGFVDLLRDLFYHQIINSSNYQTFLL